MEKTLNNFHVGEKGIITNVSGEGKIRRRLFDMGVTPGAEVMLKKKAPLGDPIEISIRGYVLTLRKSEASCVNLEVDGGFIHKRIERRDIIDGSGKSGYFSRRIRRNRFGHSRGDNETGKTEAADADANDTV